MAAHSARAGALVGACALAAAALIGTPAAAHDTLISSTPSTGEVLEQAPEEIRLTFSADLLDLGGEILVTDEQGAQHTDGAMVVDGADASIGVDDLADGGYTVAWRVVSSDGHPISGVIPFAVGDAEPPASPAAQAGEDPENTDPVPAAGGSDAEAGSGELAGSGSQPGWGRTALIAGGGALLGLLVFGGVTFARRSR